MGLDCRSFLFPSSRHSLSETMNGSLGRWYFNFLIFDFKKAFCRGRCEVLLRSFHTAGRLRYLLKFCTRYITHCQLLRRRKIKQPRFSLEILPSNCKGCLIFLLLLHPLVDIYLRSELLVD